MLARGVFGRGFFADLSQQQVEAKCVFDLSPYAALVSLQVIEASVEVGQLLRSQSHLHQDRLLLRDVDLRRELHHLQHRPDQHYSKARESPPGQTKPTCSVFPAATPPAPSLWDANPSAQPRRRPAYLRPPCCCRPKQATALDRRERLRHSALCCLPQGSGLDGRLVRHGGGSYWPSKHPAPRLLDPFVPDLDRQPCACIVHMRPHGWRRTDIYAHAT